MNSIPIRTISSFPAAVEKVTDTMHAASVVWKRKQERMHCLACIYDQLCTYPGF